MDILRRILGARTTTLVLIILVISAGLTILTKGKFLDRTIIVAMLIGMTYDLLMAMGMTLVLILGGIDLSVGSVLGLAGVAFTMLLSKHQPYVEHLGPYPIPVAILAGVGVATLCGAVNGLSVTKLKIAPFIVTLGMMAIGRGLATVWTSGWYISGLPDPYVAIGRNTFLEIPYTVYFAVIVLIIYSYLLRQWKPLNQSFYVGHNPAAAALSGLKVSLITGVGYVVSAVLSGLAGLFMTSHLAMGFFQFGQGGELNAIAAAVIGGASFAGGSGSLVGTFLATLLIAMINTGFILLRGDPNWKLLIQGLIVFVAIAVDAYRRRKEIRE
jgi:ribose transport system permease protein